VLYGREAEAYATDVFAARAAAFVAEAASAGTPFLVVVAPYAPHAPSTPAPRHAQLFPEHALPRAPGFGEFDVADKPAHIRRLPPLRERVRLRLQRRHLQRVRSLQAIDEAVALLVDTLDQHGRLDDTFVFLTSDNGFHLGEHRMGWGKQSPYEEDIGLPLVVRGPGVPVSARVTALAGNVDLAPTLAELAGTRLDFDADGRSLRPWLDGSGGPAGWRRTLLLDLWAGSSRGERDGKTRVPPYHGLRTRDALYVEYATGERELYDLENDPAQLENAIASADPERLAALSARVAALRSCAGARCRALEDQPLP
jgi:arylsulfatase A-like enzyme